MASIRKFKKEIDYLASEVISNSYTCLYFNPQRNRDEVFAIINDAVEVRNDLFVKANNPIEKHNPKLVKKYYHQLNNEVFEKVDALFERLSKACKEN